MSPLPGPDHRLPVGTAGWLLTPDDLDHLATFSKETTKEEQMRGDPIDARTLGRLADLPRQPAESPADGRYRPDGDSFPEDGITLSYGELRRLIALHLSQLAHTMPRHEPWLWAEGAARAMAEGETPLRLREVLE